MDRPMRKICAVFLIVSLVGCATTQGNIPQDTEADKKYDCSRFEAAWNVYWRAFDPVLNTKKVANVCNNGSSLACLSIPFTAPIIILAGLFGLPILFPILMISPYVRDKGCPKKAVEVSTDGAISDEQQQ